MASRSGGHLKTALISQVISDTIELAGMDWRPYLLRHYFDTQLLLAEGPQVIPHDYRMFWMGHKGSIESVYTTNKYRLPSQLLEDMRKKFNDALRFLEVEGTTETTPKPKQKVVTMEELALPLTGMGVRGDSP